tara:strand:- start:29 stop:793 length:765 start_codon:yes stop_codon:yes gene_type:complete
MQNKYFTVDVTPEVAVDRQHSAAYSAGDVLFDWTEVQVPKGTSRLIGATMLVRPKGNAAVTANNFGAFLVFSKTNTQTLGTGNGVPDKVPSNDFLGFLEIEDEHSYLTSTMKSTTVGAAGRASNTSSQANVLITPSQTGNNVGYDKVYIGGMANGAFDFITLNRINDGNIATESPGTTLVCSGSSMDVRHHFIAGDILFGSADANDTGGLIGTVASLTDATTLEVEDAIPTGVVVHNDFIYTKNPIRLILHFEK